MRVQVDHHPAALHASLGHVLDAEEAGARRVGLRAGGDDAGRPGHVGAGTIAVVVERLGHTVPVCIEQLADMGQAVPLRGVLCMQQDRIVAHHVREPGVVLAKLVVDVGLAVADRWTQDGRVATGIECVAAGQVERKAEAECPPFVDFGDPLQHLGRCQQVQAAALVIRPPIAPIGTGRTMPPPRGAARHAFCNERAGSSAKSNVPV